MTIQDLGSIGELIAAIATIATLVYLARQLRANTSAVRAESRRAHRASSSACNLLIASDPAIAALFRAGLKDFHQLSPDQQTQFAFLLGEQILVWNQNYEEFESGLLDRTHLDVTGNAYLPFLLTPGGRVWWATYCETYSPGFRAYLDARIESAADAPGTVNGDVAAQPGAAADSA